VKVFLVVISLLLLSCNSDSSIINNSETKDDISSTKLINPKALSDLMGNSDNYRLIQVSPKAIYDNEHLSNAFQLWRPEYGADSETPYGGMKASRSKMQALLRQLGVTAETTLILYDAKANVDALRLAWVLSYYGYENYKVINGGLQYCKQAGLAITKSIPPRPTESDYNLTSSIASNSLADFHQVMAAIKDTSTLIVDTREDYEFLGQPFISNDSIHREKKGAATYGSIPSAIHLNWSELADLDVDHRIKAKKDLQYNLSRVGITPDKKIILYCQSGSRTTHTYFVLKEILGYPNVKNYDGSWIEWSHKHIADSSVYITQHTDTMTYNKMYANLVDQMQTNG